MRSPPNPPERDQPALAPATRIRAYHLRKVLTGKDNVVELGESHARKQRRDGGLAACHVDPWSGHFAPGAKEHGTACPRRAGSHELRRQAVAVRRRPAAALLGICIRHICGKCNIGCECQAQLPASRRDRTKSDPLRYRSWVAGSHKLSSSVQRKAAATQQLAKAEASKNPTRSLAPRRTRTRPPPLQAEGMAAPAVDAEAMGPAHWEAAKGGNTAEARSLLDAGAPVDWRNFKQVSFWCHGVVPPSHRAHRAGQRVAQRAGCWRSVPMTAPDVTGGPRGAGARSQTQDGLGT